VIEGDAGLETTNNGCCCFPFAALVGAGTVLNSPAEPCSVLSLIIALPQLPVGSKPSSESQARARRANHSAPANSPDLCAALCCHVMRSKAMRREGNAMQCSCNAYADANANAREAMHGGRRALFFNKETLVQDGVRCMKGGDAKRVGASTR